MKHLTWFVVDVVARVIEWSIGIYWRRSRMSLYEPALAYVLQREGLIEDDRKDPGGFTKCGISLRFLKSLSNERLRGYGLPGADVVARVDVEQLTPAQISALYRGEFWDNAPFQSINNQDVCNYLFDACVDMGLAPGIKCLQRAAWSIARQRGIIADDGILGEHTLELVNGCSPAMLLAAMRSERGGEYRLIAQAKPQENSDLEGWLNRSYNKST
jgi:lysozyme family protein